MVRATVSVEGHDLPEPDTYKNTSSSLVDSARNAMGVMIGSEIREIEKIELSYKLISAEDLSYILKLFSKNNGGSFRRTVTYWCITTNRYRTCEMYIGDRSSTIISRNPNTGEVDGYKDYKFSLIEV